MPKVLSIYPCLHRYNWASKKFQPWQYSFFPMERIMALYLLLTTRSGVDQLIKWYHCHRDTILKMNQFVASNVSSWYILQRVDHDILGQLTADKCPRLVGRPKLLFVQVFIIVLQTSRCFLCNSPVGHEYMVLCQISGMPRPSYRSRGQRHGQVGVEYK